MVNSSQRKGKQGTRIYFFFRTSVHNDLYVGTFQAGIPLPDRIPLEHRETTLAGHEDREMFLRLVRKMVQWEPGQRSSAAEHERDEWIHKQLY